MSQKSDEQQAFDPFGAWKNMRDTGMDAWSKMMIQYGAKALKPVENYIGNYLNLWDNIDNPKVVESWHAQ